MIGTLTPLRWPTQRPGALVLGLGGLHHLPTRRARQRYLRTALDLGIRHFDTAPLYGNGLAERELGIAIRGHRDVVQIATKFGIPAPMYGALAPPLFIPMRLADRLLPGHRVRQTRRDFRVESLTRGLHDSLRRLGTERVEVFLAHEPLVDPPQGVAMEDAVGELKDRGLIGAFGVAGESHALPGWAALGYVDVVQAPVPVLLDGWPGAGKRRRAFFLQRSFRASGIAGTYAEFLSHLRATHPQLDMIVATRSESRLRDITAALSA